MKTSGVREAHAELERRPPAGAVRLGAPNRPEVYPLSPSRVPSGTVQELLDDIRGRTVNTGRTRSSSPALEAIAPATAGRARESGAACFARGKPYVHLDGSDNRFSIAEWPNGVTDRAHLTTRSVTRTWPDGSSETRRSDDPALWGYPRLPGEPRDDARRHRWSLEFFLPGYVEGIREGWSEDDVGRAIVHDLPRRFHALSPERQREELARRVPLTHTRWDALIAAMVEHVAWLHGHPAPEWVDEPERFLEITWVMAHTRQARLESVWYSPPAFIRHGAIPDPRDLDHRGGERRAWLP